MRLNKDKLINMALSNGILFAIIVLIIITGLTPWPYHILSEGAGISSRSILAAYPIIGARSLAPEKVLS